MSQKIHCQASPWVIAPPTTGPPSTASPVIAAEDPERPRRAARAGTPRSAAPATSGITSAAPAPWTARAAISRPTLGASAHAADASENSPSPAANSRRRPNRSPSAAPVISSTAKLSLYALTVHSSCSTEAPRSMRIVLSAVVTTSASSATISDATDATISTQTGPLRMSRPPHGRFRSRWLRPGPRAQIDR